MGDYGLEKADFDTPIIREEPSELPEVGNDEKAF